MDHIPTSSLSLIVNNLDIYCGYLNVKDGIRHLILIKIFWANSFNIFRTYGLHTFEKFV